MTDVLLVSDPAPDVTALRARIAGDVFVPTDSAWDEARLAWNLAAEQRPAAVVYADSALDVQATIVFAREHGLRVAPQGTGHFAIPLGSLDQTILLKTERMRRVQIDPELRRASVGAGVIWQEVADAAAPYGLAGLAGSSPDVGVVGYSLGAGMGWLARKYGLAANSIVSAEVVTADGRIVRTDRDHEPELFWALRGGGGSFGVVTALEFTLYPVEKVYAGVLFWPIERVAEVLKAWRGWVDTVPDEVTSVARLLQFPPLPEIPEPLRGGSFVVVEAAYLGSECGGEQLLRPLRALAPAMDTFAMIPANKLQLLHMDPEQPVPAIGDGRMLDDLPPEAIDAVVDTGPGPLLSVEVRQMGGALARSSPEHGAVDTLESPFAMFAVGLVTDDEQRVAVEEHVTRVQEALAPWTSQRRYFDFAEHEADGTELYPELTYRRLRAIKAQYDPDERFCVAHPIAPAR